MGLVLTTEQAACLITPDRLIETFRRALLTLPIVQMGGLGLQRTVNSPTHHGSPDSNQVPCSLQATCFLELFLHLSLGFLPYH